MRVAVQLLATSTLVLLCPHVPAQTTADREEAPAPIAPRDTLEQIDLAALPPIIVSIENVDLDAVHSGIICRRVRVIYSRVKRTFCITREQWLARQGRSNRERVAHDMQVLREIHRYQNRERINRSVNSLN